MATKLVRLRSQFKQSYATNTSLVKTKVNDIQTTLQKIEIPDRFKGTVVEKWLKYWKTLYIDYRDVILDVGKQAKEKPIRFTLYAGIAASTIYCAKRNPNETDYREQLRCHNINMLLVNEICHNPESAQYLTYLERCYNENIIRKLNLGVCSLLWIDNYDKALGLYKATCTYMQPDYSTWHKRIIDVGFLGKWWKLDEKMIDYDVNSNNL